MRTLLLNAAARGDLAEVQRLAPDTEDLIRQALHVGCERGRLDVIIWLLTKGGATVEAENVWVAAILGQLPTLEWLLEQNPTLISYVADGNTIWNLLEYCVERLKVGTARSTANTELSSLLKVMVLLEDAPADFKARLSPQHAELATRGKLLRAQLPIYLEQQRAAVVNHSPLPAVLQSLVVAYAVPTPGDKWKYGLETKDTRAKRCRSHAEIDMNPPRRSLRLREKHQ
jgi:hypothetical protein